MKRIIATLAVLPLLTIGTFAQPRCADDKKTPKLFEKKSDKERIYKLPLDVIWNAALKAAAEANVIDYSNEKEGIITYKTGMSMASWGFRVSVTLTSLEDGRTRIKLTTQKRSIQLVSWGAGGRTAEKFFKGLDKQIANRTH